MCNNKIAEKQITKINLTGNVEDLSKKIEMKSHRDIRLFINRLNFKGGFFWRKDAKQCIIILNIFSRVRI